VSFYDMAGADQANLEDEEFPYFNTGKERLKINMAAFDINDELQRFKINKTEAKPTHAKETEEQKAKCTGHGNRKTTRTPTIKAAEDPMDFSHEYGAI